jgi:hypothetical protein
MKGDDKVKDNFWQTFLMFLVIFTIIILFVGFLFYCIGLVITLFGETVALIFGILFMMIGLSLLFAYMTTH